LQSTRLDFALDALGALPGPARRLAAGDRDEVGVDLLPRQRHREPAAAASGGVRAPELPGRPRVVRSVVPPRRPLPQVPLPPGSFLLGLLPRHGRLLRRRWRSRPAVLATLGGGGGGVGLGRDGGVVRVPVLVPVEGQGLAAPPAGGEVEAAEEERVPGP